MSVLTLRLAGPLQSWGDASRFNRRETSPTPTKSGVLGLLAAASGRRRTDPIEDLANLAFGVRIDQPGTILTDFHTAHTRGPHKPPVVTRRDYLADAVFVAAVSGDDTLIDALHNHIRQPSFPLSLGRRSCPTTGKLTLGIHHGTILTVLTDPTHTSWQASPWYQRRQPKTVSLDLFLDAETSDTANLVHDTPVSYNPHDRRHSWRRVTRQTLHLDNPHGTEPPDPHFDWFAALQES